MLATTYIYIANITVGIYLSACLQMSQLFIIIHTDIEMYVET